MRYIVRLNKKAVNPLTRQLDPKRLWEVEQLADKDSERVVWHAEAVRINEQKASDFFQTPVPPKTIWDWELHYKGYVARGQDNAVVVIGEPDGESD